LDALFDVKVRFTMWESKILGMSIGFCGTDLAINRTRKDDKDSCAEGEFLLQIGRRKDLLEFRAFLSLTACAPLLHRCMVNETNLQRRSGNVVKDLSSSDLLLN
jgi:hypothetical protein